MLTSELNQDNEIIFPYSFSWWVGYWKSLAGKVVHHTLQELAVPCIQLGSAPHVQWDRETDLNVQERTCMLYILTPNIRRLSISVSSKACIPRIGLNLSNRKHCLGVPHMMFDSFHTLFYSQRCRYLRCYGFLAFFSLKIEDARYTQGSF